MHRSFYEPNCFWKYVKLVSMRNVAILRYENIDYHDYRIFIYNNGLYFKDSTETTKCTFYVQHLYNIPLTSTKIQCTLKLRNTSKKHHAFG